MTDEQLEQRLRDWYRAEVPDREVAPIALRTALATIPRESTLGGRRIGSRRGITLLAAAALVGLLAGTAVVGGFPSPRPAPAFVPGVWTTTGGMLYGRALHSATLLPDGRVLVVGGYGLNQDSAELYNPATRSWTATAKLVVGRAEHTATLLADGRVLVVGGVTVEGDADAELFDPNTGSWTATGNTAQPRHGHTATLLLDGRVLVAGGADDATAELYDPRTGTWTATGNMVMARHYHTATLLPDGRVLVAGDFAGDDLSSSAELYDPRTATWTATGSMMHGRWDYVATLLPDGTVLVAGGEDRASASSAELYDPGSGTWTTTGSMTDARQWPTSALLQDGNVLVTGGNGAREEVASAELYDPRSHTWTATGSMHVARRNFTATLLRDGTVLVAGGIPDDPASVSAELYDPGNLPSVVVPSQLPIAEPSAAPVAGRIVYTRFRTLTKGQEGCKNFCHRASVFTSNEDGSDERELIPGPYSFVVAMSPDGSSLIISQRLPDGDHGYLTDVDGSKPQRLDTGCRLPCVEDSVGSFWWPAVAFSPDGSRLAFVRGFGDDILGDPRSVIAIMDMATGAVVELDSTAGAASPPSWSPDGARLVFGSFVVNADGTNLLQVVPAALSSGATFGGARWSPDGSLIVFTSFVDTVVQGNSQRLIDIYTVRPDGSGLQRITTDSVGPLGTTEPGDFGARYPSWTRDGRIVFTRDADQGEAVMQLWVMDRDGSNATRLDPSDAATLTAIGCVSCQYPATDAGELPSVALWITAP